MIKTGTIIGGRKSLDCEEINNKSFQRKSEKYIKKAQLNKCLSRSNHQSKPCKIVDDQCVNNDSKILIDQSKKTEDNNMKETIFSPPSELRSKSSLKNENMSMSDAYIIRSYHRKDFKKITVDKNFDDDFIHSLQSILKFHEVSEDHSLLQDSKTIRTKVNLSKNKVTKMTESDVMKIALKYNICILVWNFNTKAWYIYGDVFMCTLRIHLFLDDERYGYLIPKKNNDMKNTKEKKESAKKESAKKESGKKEKTKDNKEDDFEEEIIISKNEKKSGKCNDLKPKPLSEYQGNKLLRRQAFSADCRDHGEEIKKNCRVPRNGKKLFCSEK
tara:strand:+ start:898 stop:1884 length:987 start_codon:yes stop_codon:yes gene_type:complete